MRIHMHKTPTKDAKRCQDGSPEGVRCLELLSWRFSSAEIERLSRMQLLHRQHPDVLDMPLEESRLRFARWLVEHGRLNEDMESRLEGHSRSAAVSVMVSGQGSESATSDDISSGEHMDVLMPVNAPRRGSEHLHRVLLGAWSRIRRGMGKIAELGRELGRMEYPLDAWWPYGPYGPYDPNDGPHSITDDPWFWRHL